MEAENGKESEAQASIGPYKRLYDFAHEVVKFRDMIRSCRRGIRDDVIATYFAIYKKDVRTESINSNYKKPVKQNNIESGITEKQRSAIYACVRKGKLPMMKWQEISALSLKKATELLEQVEADEQANGANGSKIGE